MNTKFLSCSSCNQSIFSTLNRSLVLIKFFIAKFCLILPQQCFYIIKRAFKCTPAFPCIIFVFYFAIFLCKLFQLLQIIIYFFQCCISCFQFLQAFSHNIIAIAAVIQFASRAYAYLFISSPGLFCVLGRICLICLSNHPINLFFNIRQLLLWIVQSIQGSLQVRNSPIKFLVCSIRIAEFFLSVCYCCIHSLICHKRKVAFYILFFYFC